MNILIRDWKMFNKRLQFTHNSLWLQIHSLFKLLTLCDQASVNLIRKLKMTGMRRWLTMTINQFGILSIIFKKHLGSNLSWTKSWRQRNFKISNWLFRGLETRKDWLFTENQNPRFIIRCIITKLTFADSHFKDINIIINWFSHVI